MYEKSIQHKTDVYTKEAKILSIHTISQLYRITMSLTIKAALTEDELQNSQLVKNIIIIEEIPLTREISEHFQNVEKLEVQSEVFDADVIFPKCETMHIKTVHNIDQILKSHKSSLRKLVINGVSEQITIPSDIHPSQMMCFDVYLNQLLI